MNCTRYANRERPNQKRDDARVMHRNGYNRVEIARALGVPRATVRTWLDMRSDP